MITYRKTLDGYLQLSTISSGYLVTRKYAGYTKTEATQLFKQYLKESY